MANNYYTGFNTSQFNISEDGEWVYTPTTAGTENYETNEQSRLQPPPPPNTTPVSNWGEPTGNVESETNKWRWATTDEPVLNPRIWRQYKNSNEDNLPTREAVLPEIEDSSSDSIDNSKQDTSLGAREPVSSNALYNTWSIHGHDSIDFAPNQGPHQETKIPQPLEVDEYYSPSSLRMTESVSGELYLSIPLVFKHVTLGGKLCENKLMELGTYIVQNNHALRDRPKVLIQKIKPVTGEINEIYIKKYAWSDYGLLAKSCLDWAFENPDSIAF
jgi:hypothetical protein